MCKGYIYCLCFTALYLSVRFFIFFFIVFFIFLLCILLYSYLHTYKLVFITYSLNCLNIVHSTLTTVRVSRLPHLHSLYLRYAAF